MKIRLTQAAVRDLHGVRRYIAIDSERAAMRVVAKLHESIALMGKRPHFGRPTPLPGTREWSVTGLPYVIPYRILDDTVEIIHIWHTSRNRPPEW